MPKSRTHKAIQRRVAAPRGQTEKKIWGKRRLDVKKGHVATEIERSGNIKQALSRLRTQRTAKKVLMVPTKDLDKAKGIAEKEGMKVMISNLSRTKRRFVKR